MQKIIYKCLMIVLMMLVISSCEENPSKAKKPVEEKKVEGYKKFKARISDYNWFESDNGSTNMSHLKGFDSHNLEHWRAILEYGYDRSNTAMQLGKRRVIFFTETDKIEKQYNFDDISDHNAEITFAMYQTLPNGKELMTLNPYGTFPEKFFDKVKENKEVLNSNHHNALN